jgi:hypothetical protein
LDNLIKSIKHYFASEKLFYIYWAI